MAQKSKKSKRPDRRPARFKYNLRNQAEQNKRRNLKRELRKQGDSMPEHVRKAIETRLALPIPLFSGKAKERP